MELISKVEQILKLDFFKMEQIQNWNKFWNWKKIQKWNNFQIGQNFKNGTNYKFERISNLKNFEFKRIKKSEQNLNIFQIQTFFRSIFLKLNISIF
jgi:hypothetical protein